MSIESNNFGYEKVAEKTEKERKLEIAKNLEFSKEKQVLLEKIDKEKKLTYLKSLVERGLINITTAEHIVEGEALDNVQIKEIFEKIDEIEEIQNIESILPKYLRISKEDYIKALEDSIFRKEILKKLDNSLLYLYNSSNKFPLGIINFFSGLMRSLDKNQKNTVKVQENTIDIKRSLV
ncbi:hypothetical protein M0P65_04055 [Candidatus Gracilibacteria bacterium]|nr:hypothetical protein [Candidatus Gracilibacteria bacterium]